MKHNVYWRSTYTCISTTDFEKPQKWERMVWRMAQHWIPLTNLFTQLVKIYSALEEARTIGLITEATVGKRISRSTKTTQQAVQNGVRGDDGESAVGWQCRIGDGNVKTGRKNKEDKETPKSFRFTEKLIEIEWSCYLKHTKEEVEQYLKKTHFDLERNKDLGSRPRKLRLTFQNAESELDYEEPS